MTAQNITFKDYAVGGTPVLVINGAGKFRIDNLGQTPTSVPEILQDPFSTLTQQAAAVGLFSLSSGGVYYGISDSITRVELAQPVRNYKPMFIGSPGYDTSKDGDHQPVFPIFGVNGGSSRGPDTYDSYPVSPLEFMAPVKIWALNANTVTIVTLRVWNWF